jgi:diguanylate cyclase (GGDEF)-like protein
MSTRAWIYVCAVLVAGLALILLALPIPTLSPLQWLTFAALTMLATLAQLFKAEVHSRQSYYATLVFIFAGVLLLPPILLALLIAISYTIEWVKERLISSPLLRAWYIQPFNIATHIIAGIAAQQMYLAINGTLMAFQTTLAVIAVALAALTYTLCNHVLIGLALVLARGVSLHDSGILDLENLLTDLVLLCLGYTVAVLWTLNPWLIVPALAPLLLIYRALTIPLLKQEAQTDAKTGLLNARYFSKLFEAELERARRFNRPLALIVADLDLLRNINNTYGHLAGDAVLSGIGQNIRESIRDYDIAGRFGGEEFVIALPETGPREAHEVAERLRQTIAGANFSVTTSPAPIRATMSLGVACFPDDANTQKNLIHAADVAVYQAKIQGRNRVVCSAEVPLAIKTQHAEPGDAQALEQTASQVMADTPLTAANSRST